MVEKTKKKEDQQTMKEGRVGYSLSEGKIIICKHNLSLKKKILVIHLKVLKSD